MPTGLRHEVNAGPVLLASYRHTGYYRASLFCMRAMMPLRQLKLWLLLLLMLSHAVASCDSLVVHLPAEAHPLSLAIDSCHADAASDSVAHHYHANPASHQSGDSGEQQPHSVHAHVSCFVPYQALVAALTAPAPVIGSRPTHAASLLLAPPVPPPTLRS